MFQGHQKRASESSPRTNVSKTPAERPVPVLTASQKKLALIPASDSSSLTSEDVDSEKQMVGTRLFSCQTLQEAIGSLCCPLCCSPITVAEDYSLRKGLVTEISIYCTSENCTFKRFLSDPRSSLASDINFKSVLAIKMIGKSREGLATVTAIMHLPPPLSHTSYGRYNVKLLEATSLHCKKSFIAASTHLHDLENVPHNQVIDVMVTCDGTWSKRGFTALYGVVVVASWKTGQVLDVEVLSKHCASCTQRTEEDKDSDEYQAWWAKHKDSCSINYEGSSPAMECAGALRIWKRSVEERSLRYTSVICDGDSKMANLLNSSKPYGEGVDIVKHECVGHVQKRLT